jgi:hypothetical protein
MANKRAIFRMEDLVFGEVDPLLKNYNPEASFRSIIWRSHSEYEPQTPVWRCCVMSHQRPLRFLSLL